MTIDQFANVTDLQLSETVVKTPCPPGQVPVEGEDCPDSMSVNVTTTAFDPEGATLVYSYIPSAGQIVGQGANVSWDLSGVSPGTYTITAGVDDGCGVCGTTQTRTITVEACNCRVVCVCPSGVNVVGPSGLVNAGDNITFTAEVTDGNPTYKWTVSAGTIVGSDDTSSITVATTPDMAGSNVVASVVVGASDCECPDQTGQDTAVIQELPIPFIVDEFGKLVADDLRGRLDNYFVTLQNNPNAQGYIINYGPPREVAARERLITNHINFRNAPRDRIVIVNGGNTGEGIQTKLWIVPAGAEPPTP